MPGLELVDIELNIPGKGMGGGKVLVMDHHRAFRAIEFHDSHPVRIEREIEFLAGADREVDLPRVAIAYQSAQFPRFACRPQIRAAAIAAPALVLEVDVQVFRYAD